MGQVIYLLRRKYTNAVTRLVRCIEIGISETDCATIEIVLLIVCYDFSQSVVFTVLFVLAYDLGGDVAYMIMFSNTVQLIWSFISLIIFGRVLHSGQIQKPILSSFAINWRTCHVAILSTNYIDSDELHMQRNTVKRRTYNVSGNIVLFISPYCWFLTLIYPLFRFQFIFSYF